jgi:hypothetical protein
VTLASYKEAEKELANTEHDIRRRRLEKQLNSKKSQLDFATQIAEQTQQMLNDYILEMDAKFTEMRLRLSKHRKSSPQEE